MSNIRNPVELAKVLVNKLNLACWPKFECCITNLGFMWPSLSLYHIHTHTLDQTFEDTFPIKKSFLCDWIYCLKLFFFFSCIFLSKTCAVLNKWMNWMNGWMNQSHYTKNRFVVFRPFIAPVIIIIIHRIEPFCVHLASNPIQTCRYWW